MIKKIKMDGVPGEEIPFLANPTMKKVVDY
jgi:hypothetical protein